jgi:restriction endonuclease S subunit
MTSYIIRPTTITRDEVLASEYSWSSKDFRKFKIKNTNNKFIKELIKFENVGEQINVEEYLSFDTSCYLGTISGMDNLIYNPKNGERISPIVYKKSTKKLEKGDVIVSRNASLGKISIISNDTNVILNGGLSYLRFIESYKFYTMAFFMVNYGSEYLISLTSGGGTQQNAKRQNVLDIPIPFPTTANNPNLEDVQKLVSLIVQNIIHKEEQIKLKNIQIDELIERELYDNQGSGSYEYKYPTREEMMSEGRMDTGLYEREFRKIDFLIKNYKMGSEKHETFVKKYFSGSTPNFIETVDKSKPFFIRPTEMTTSRVYLSLRNVRLNIKDTTRIDETEGIILPRKGGTYCLYKPSNMDAIIGDSVKFAFYNKDVNTCFISCLLTSRLIQKYLNIVKQKTNGGSLTESNLSNIPIPSFPEPKQKEIASLYYNKIDVCEDLNLENYLELQMVRNSQLGIFQLNMEIFDLRNKLETLVDKIVNEQPIIIEL